jgi:hypothetical protein
MGNWLATYLYNIFIFMAGQRYSARASSLLVFSDHDQTHHTPLDE